MPTLYTRIFNLKDSLSDTEVLDQWRFFDGRDRASMSASSWDTVDEGLFWCGSTEGRHQHIVGDGGCQRL
jgi:hypothetical protein